MNYAGSMPMGQEASVTGNLWAGSNQPMLGRMALSGGAGETTLSEIGDRHVWGGSPWLQQPLQQQVGSDNTAAKDVQGLAQSKEQALLQLPSNKFDQAQQEVETNDGEIDVDSEIYERAVRFLDEISTEESGSEDQPASGSGDKDDSLFRSEQMVKEHRSDAPGFPPMWNPQEAWVSDANHNERWPGSNHWAMQSVDRIA